MSRKFAALACTFAHHPAAAHPPLLVACPAWPCRERNINEVYVMYSHTFPHLSERFFKGATWPTAEAILHLVDGDHVFGLLYREMYYRYCRAPQRTAQRRRVGGGSGTAGHAVAAGRAGGWPCRWLDSACTPAQPTAVRRDGRVPLTSAAQG